MPPLRLRVGLTCALAAIATLAAGPAAFGADWLQPSTISRVVPQYVGEPVTLASPDGTATTLWVDASLEPSAADLRMVRAEPDGTRSAVSDITSLPSAINSGLVAAAGPDGRISLAWIRDQRIEVLRLAPDGTTLAPPLSCRRMAWTRRASPPSR